MSQTPDIERREHDANENPYRRHLQRDTLETLRSQRTDLQNTIIRLTRELGEARDAEAAEIVELLRGRLAHTFGRHCADSIAHHEHRKELSHEPEKRP